MDDFGRQLGRDSWNPCALYYTCSIRGCATHFLQNERNAANFDQGLDTWLERG
ncbi:hypothetical protein [Nocardia sp. NPDC004711]